MIVRKTNCILLSLTVLRGVHAFFHSAAGVFDAPGREKNQVTLVWVEVGCVPVGSEPPQCPARLYC